jgi:hypothetical protein
LDAYRRRYVAQAAGFGNESASDRSQDEPHRGCHSIAEELAEGEGEMNKRPERYKTGSRIYWLSISVGVVLAGVAIVIALSSRHRHPSDVEINLMFVAGLTAAAAFLFALRWRDSRE